MFKNKTGLGPSTFTAVALAGATFATPALADDHTKVGGKIYASYGVDLTDTPYAGYQDGDPSSQWLRSRSCLSRLPPENRRHV